MLMVSKETLTSMPQILVPILLKNFNPTHAWMDTTVQQALLTALAMNFVQKTSSALEAV